MSTEYMPSKRIAFERIKVFSHGGVTARLMKGYVLLSDGVSGMWRFRTIISASLGDRDEFPYALQCPVHELLLLSAFPPITSTGARMLRDNPDRGVAL